METVGAYEAKTHLPKLLERVSKGEHITITRHGVPIAILQPFSPKISTDTRVVIEEIRRLSEKCALSGDSLRDMIEEGRR